MKENIKHNILCTMALFVSWTVQLLVIYFWTTEFLQNKVTFMVLIYGITTLMGLIIIWFNRGSKIADGDKSKVYVRQFIITVLLVFLIYYLNEWGVIEDLVMRLEGYNMFVSGYIIAEMTCKREKKLNCHGK
ncbi:MAG: hypothetical protein MR303_03895 [Emergencia sp.]|nr:hypothetical protein [Emergencia sp.]